MGAKNSKTKPQNTTDRNHSSPHSRSSPTHTSPKPSNLSPKSYSSLSKTNDVPIDRPRNAEYRAILQDPEQTLAKSRTHCSDTEDAGQEATVHVGGEMGSGWREGYGLTGLRNLGNTCYMNSILQCICRTPGFSDYFFSLHLPSSPKYRLKGRITEAFAGLIGKIRREEDMGTITPLEVKASVGRVARAFAGYGQQDAQEFLRVLLEALNQELNQVRNRPKYRELSGEGGCEKVAKEWFQYSVERENSVVTEYFRGQLLSTTTCGRCNAQSIACDTFLDLSVPVPISHSTITLEDCLRSFTSKTEVEGFKCDKCHKSSRSMSHMTLWKLPQIFVIHLKRFSNTREKVNTSVKFPTQRLNLSPFAHLSNDESVKSPFYRLIAVSHHVGDLGSGHYFA